MKKGLIFFLIILLYSTCYAQNKFDTINVVLNKVNFDADSNDIYLDVYLVKDSLKNVDANIKLPTGNTIKKYATLNLKYFTYDSTNEFLFIKALIGYTKEYDLCFMIDKNFNYSFEDDPVYIIPYDKEIKSRKDFFDIAALISIDSIPIKKQTGETDYRRVSIKLAPSNNFEGFFKSKKEIEKSQKMSLTLFKTDIWENDFKLKDSVYLMRLAVNPLFIPFKRYLNYHYLKQTNFLIFNKKEIKSEYRSFGSLDQFINSYSDKNYIKLNNVFIKPIEFDPEQASIKFIVLNNLDSVKKSVHADTINSYRNKNLVTNNRQTIIDTTKPYTLIEFSGSWCLPCKKILPDVKKIHAKYKDAVSVKIITVEETEAIAKNYLKQMKVSFDVFFESLNTAINVSNFSLVQYLGFRFYPSFYLFDKRGNLVFNGSSYSALMQIESIIKAYN